jgi:hypothetical protein
MPELGSIPSTEKKIFLKKQRAMKDQVQVGRLKVDFFGNLSLCPPKDSNVSQVDKRTHRRAFQAKN